MSDPLPDLRATDADRERVAERLRAAAADGQITFDELDERLHAAYAARTGRDLVPLTEDLQEPGAALLSPEPAAGQGVTVRPGPGGARWLVAIMGGCDRKGRWRLAERATSLNIMGGADLDLNQAELAATTSSSPSSRSWAARTSGCRQPPGRALRVRLHGRQLDQARRRAAAARRAGPAAAPDLDHGRLGRQARAEAVSRGAPRAPQQRHRPHRH